MWSLGVLLFFMLFGELPFGVADNGSPARERFEALTRVREHVLQCKYVSLVAARDDDAFGLCARRD